MTLYWKRQLSLEASQLASGKKIIFHRGDIPVRFSGLSTLTDGGLQKIALSIPTTDQDVLPDGISTGKVLYIESDTEITVKLDTTSDTGFIISPLNSSASDLDDSPGVCYLEGSFTHVYVSVAGTSGTAHIIVAVLGA